MYIIMNLLQTHIRMLIAYVHYYERITETYKPTTSEIEIVHVNYRVRVLSCTYMCIHYAIHFLQGHALYTYIHPYIRNCLRTYR